MFSSESPRAPCPFLPEPDPHLNHRVLTAHGPAREDAFFLDALRYAQTLWLRGLSARALLAATRALYAEPGPGTLQQWPLPYRAIKWICRAHDGRGFLGNPRISYQHQAGRIAGAGAARKQARAWAAWHLVRQALPELPGDPRHRIEEPTREEIRALLEGHGFPGEVEMWLEACAD